MLKLFFSLYLFIIGVYVIESFLVEPIFVSSYQEELDEDIAKDYIGPYLLLEQLHKTQAPEQWQALLLEISARSNTPMEARPLAEWHLPKQAQNILNKGEIWVEDWDSNITYKAVGPNMVAKIGPMQTIDSVEQASQYMLLIAPILLGLTILLWLTWLQYCLKKLEFAAICLSRGRLDTTAPTGLLAVGNLNKTFNMMAERLNRLFSSHKHLTNAVSHELRSPIARIRFQLEMMADTTDESKKMGHMQGIAEDLDDMDGLVEEMLSYARMERAELTASIETLSITAWLTAQQAHLGQEVKTPIELQLPKAAERITADPAQLARLLRNLVCNADRYAATKIVIGADVNNKEQQLWIDDDGPGIALKDRERLFEPFVLLEQSRNKNQSGYGLGLAIAAQIARCHGGHIRIEDSPYGGARLIMTWPLPLTQT